MTESNSRWIVAGALACVAAAAFALDPLPPETRVEPAIESFHGTIVADSYRWLEATNSPETIAWFRAQDAHARNLLDALPGRAAMRARLAALNATDIRVKDLQWAGDRLFYLKRAPGEAGYRLFVRDGLAAPERALVDPQRYGRGAEAAAIDYFRVSPNGERMAVGISTGGSEDATLHVLDVATSQPIGAPIPRARWAAPAWRFDSSVLFYTQQRIVRPAAAAFERLRGSVAFQRTYDSDGTTRDTALLGAALAPQTAIDADDTPSIEASPLSPFVIGVVQHGVQRELSLYVARLTDLRGTATPWRKLAGPERGIVGFDLRGEWIYLVTSEHAPRYQVVRWSLKEPRPFLPASAEVVVAESGRVIVGVAVANEALYVRQLDAGHARLLRLPFNLNPRKSPAAPRARARGTPRAEALPRVTEIELPFAGAIDEIVTNPLHSGALLRMAGWTEAPAYFAVDGRSRALSRTSLLPPSRVDFGGVTATEARVPGHDGVAIPVSIVHAKHRARDGTARILLDAYGAYGISQGPYFAPSLLAWFEQGGIFVVAHVRGGGELGKAWHRAGFQQTKANTWRDVVAVAEWLVREHWTTPSRLVVSGSSAGGIAAGNAMIDRPELFAAMVSVAGFHDTLRSETGLVGPANVPEFGSVADAAAFEGLLAMSSYARLRDGVPYPAALFCVGFNDPRVDAWDPGKMAARMQAVNGGPGGSGRPALLRVDFAGGHSGGSSTQLIDTYADIYAFALWQTGAAEFMPP